MDQTRYAGFWVRFGAAIIDGFLISIVTSLLAYVMVGPDFIKGIGLGWSSDIAIGYLIPAILTIWFWRRYLATPGKMVMGIEVVDSDTRKVLTLPQAIGRYLSYYISALPLALGYIWAAFDPKKQAWHDKLAGTVVIYKRRSPDATEHV